MHAPKSMRERLEAEKELRSATIDFTRAYHTMVRAGGRDADKAETQKAQARLRAAEEAVERLAKRNA